MCQTDLHAFLEALPKCEHHVHIEGTLSPNLLFELASKNNITLPADDPSFSSQSALQSRYERFTSLDDFLHYYFIGFSVLVTASDFEDLTYAYLSHAHSQTVRHAEVFFDPQAHTDRGVPYATVVTGLTAAKKRAAVDFPELSVLFIPCLLRHLPVPSAHDMLAAALEAGHFADGTLVGFGMSGTEKDKHPSLYASVYEAAREAGVRNFTAHAGEEGPAGNVSAALSHLGVGRIDHGRCAFEDEHVVRDLVERETMLTLCPISNVVLKGVARVEDMPIRKCLDAGVRFLSLIHI